jgi:anthranilate synthase component 2
MKVIVIDNYDSFTYNLVHYLEELNCTVIVKRNDQVNLSEIEGFDRIVLSPGPGIPEEAGLLKQIISKYASTKNILGVCLGHQAIAEVFGAELENLKSVFHGVASEINIIKNDPLFKDLNNPLTVGRYHSWVVKEPLPECLEVLAFDENKQIMALKHKEYKIRGVQFHPE